MSLKHERLYPRKSADACLKMHTINMAISFEILLLSENLFIWTCRSNASSSCDSDSDRIEILEKNSLRLSRNTWPLSEKLNMLRVTELGREILSFRGMALYVYESILSIFLQSVVRRFRLASRWEILLSALESDLKLDTNLRSKEVA